MPSSWTLAAPIATASFHASKAWRSSSRRFPSLRDQLLNFDRRNQTPHLAADVVTHGEMEIVVAGSEFQGIVIPDAGVLQRNDLLGRQLQIVRLPIVTGVFALLVTHLVSDLDVEMVTVGFVNRSCF